MKEIEKTQPQATDIEEAILGAILLDKDALLEVVDIITENSFYNQKHKLIYAACLELNNKSESIDILTVTQQLKKDGTLNIVGGAYAITQLTNRASPAQNIEYHARIVEEKSIRRNVIKSCSEIIQDSYDETVDTFEVTEKLLTEAYNVGDVNKGENKETNTEILRRLKTNIQNADKLKGITGLTTGIAKIDQLYGGYQDTHLIIKAGRPSMGKTAQALCEATHMAHTCGKKVLFFSLEMSSIELMQRVVSINTDIPINKFKEGNMSNDDWKHYNEVTSELMNENLKIIDTPGLSLNQVKKISKKFALRNDLAAIYIDYLQLMSNNIKGGNREQEISSISRGLKVIAKELSVPVIALSQLSRAVEQRGGSKKPMLSDLRESGSIEQDADSVQFLYRPEYYGLMEDEDGNSTLGVGYLMIAKNRHGATKDIPMMFNGACTKFSDQVDDSEFNGLNNSSMPLSDDFDGHIPISSQDAKEEDDVPF